MNSEDQGQEQQIDPSTVDAALGQLYSGGLRLASNEVEQAQPYNPDFEPSPDEVWETFAGDPDLDFDHTTHEGRRLFELFKIADAERHKFTMEAFKNMATTVASVPADIVKGLVRSPLQAPLSAVDGVLRDVRDLYGLIAQSEDTGSPLFRFKDLIWGTGTVESQIKQLNEARHFARKSRALEEGRADLLSDFVPDDQREFVKSLIDPKLAHALSYIGLETPHLLLSAVRGSSRKAFKASMTNFRDVSLNEAASEASDSFKFIKDHFDNSAKRFRALALRTGGTAMSETAEVAQKPFSYIKSKLDSGTSTITEATGMNSNVLRNAATTAMVEAGERATGISPIRSTLFSLGMKPLVEYASVLGNELIDAAQGVVTIKPSQVGMTTLERLARNGSRIPLSTEAQAVAKMANVVIGWPMSMSIPTLKRAIGDAAYMGVLGYLNARGEGAASGMGVGFAWGGMSGALRHIHNIYNHSAGHELLIRNFDEITMQNVERADPSNAHSIRSILSKVDALNDLRVSSTIRASLEMALASDKALKIHYGTIADLEKATGRTYSPKERAVYSQARGFNQDSVIWINSEFDGNSAEVIAHEAMHTVINKHIWDNFEDKNSIMEAFLGSKKDGGFMKDEDMALLLGDYLFQTRQDPRLTLEMSVVRVRGILDGLRLAQQNGQVDWTDLVNDGGRLAVPRHFTEQSNAGAGPFLKMLFDEAMAYYMSEAFLNKGADYFLRNPHERSMRNWAENFMMLKTQRQVASLEEAGVLVRRAFGNSARGGRSAFESVFWEDGKFVSVPVLDDVVQQIVQRAMRHADINVTLMNPERAAAWFKDTGKSQFANVVKGGMVAKGKAEIDEIITQNTDKVAEVFRRMPENKRPKFEVGQGGNEILDFSQLSNDHWNALKASGVFNQKDYEALRTLAEVVRDTRAGKPVMNTFTAQYLGRTQQVQIGALVKRLTGNDVPVTFRHFAPFAIELRYDKFDEQGRPLRKPKGHITIHTVDVAVLNRRRMKMWSRPEVRSLFTDFGHFTRTFAEYMNNLSQDASKRLPSAEFFRKEFGDNAEKVRDYMYETFGGRKRMDEGYANIPSTGYAGNKDGPNYPFHSLRFELLANIDRRPSVFSETFGNQLRHLPYNHKNAYDGIRTNLMAGGFIEKTLASGKKYWGNHLGYEIRQSGRDMESSRLNVFSPYGALLGNFLTLKRAIAFAEKHSKDLPPQDVFVRHISEDAESTGESFAIDVPYRDVYSGGSNLMVGKRLGSGEYELHTIKYKKKSDVMRALSKENLGQMNEPALLGHSGSEGIVKIEGKRGKFAVGPFAKYTRLEEIFESDTLFSAYPEFKDLVIAVGNVPDESGGFVMGIPSPRESRVLLYVSRDKIDIRNLDTIQMYAEVALQSRIELQDHHNGKLNYTTAAFSTFDPIGMELGSAVLAAAKFQKGFDSYIRSNPDKTLEDYLQNVRVEAIQQATSALEFQDWRQGAKPDPDPKKDNKGTPFFTEYGFARGTFENVRNYDKPRFTPAWSPEHFGLGPNAKSKGPHNVSDFTPDEVRAVNDYYLGILEKIKSGSYTYVQLGNALVLFANGDVLQMPAEVKAAFDKQVKVREYKKGQIVSERMVSGHAIHSQVMHSMNGFFHHVAATPISRDLEASEGAYRKWLDTVSEESIDGGYVADIDAQINDAKTKIAEGHILAVIRPTGKEAAAGTSLSVTLSERGFSVLLKKEQTVSVGANNETRDFGRLSIRGRWQMLGTKLAFDGNLPFTDLDLSARGNVYGYSKNFTAQLGLLGTLIANGFSKDTAFKSFEALSGPDPLHIKIKRLIDVLSAVEGRGERKYATLRVAQAVLLMSEGHSILDGKDPDRVFEGIRKVNSGFEIIAEVMFNSGDGFLNPENLGNQITRRAFVEKAPKSEAEKMQIQMEGKKLASDINQLIKPLIVGWNQGQDKTSRGNLMVGGYNASRNAEIERMAALGMFRSVRLDDGRVVPAFEFSDARAEIDLTSAQGRLALVPFVGDNFGPTGGLDYFISKFKSYTGGTIRERITQALKAYNTGRMTRPVKLGELLKHDDLYNFYPQLKNVTVVFTEGMDAAFWPSRMEIHVGVENMLIREMMDRGMVEGDALRSENKYRLSEAMILDDMRSLLIHEVQHGIQALETWLHVENRADLAADNPYQNQDIGQKLMPLLLREILGLKGVDFAGLMDDTNKLNNNIVFDRLKKTGIDFEKARQEFASMPPEVAESKLMEIFSSPMAIKLGFVAKGMLHDFAAQHANWARTLLEGVPANSKEAEALRGYIDLSEDVKAKTKEVIQAVKDGVLTDKEGNFLLFGDTNGPFVRLHEARKQVARDIGRMFPDERATVITLGDGLGNGSVPKTTVFLLVRWFSNAEVWKSENTNSSILTAPHRRMVMSALEFLTYRMSMPERQAANVEARSRKTQMELNEESMTAPAWENEVLDAISVGGGNSIPELYARIHNGSPIKFSDPNLMVGGVGPAGRQIVEEAAKLQISPAEAVSKRKISPAAWMESNSLNYLRTLASSTLLSYRISSVKGDMRRLGMYFVEGDGWEVMEDGSVQLVSRQAIVMGNKEPAEIAGNLQRRQSDNPYSDILSTGGRITYYRAVKNDLGSTITLQELVDTIGGTVLAEWTDKTPTRVVDAILSNEFPVSIEAGNIRQALSEMGLTHDDFVMANLDSLESAFAGATLTKEELVNILAINHKRIVTSEVFGSAYNAKKLSKAVGDVVLDSKTLKKAIVGLLGRSSRRDKSRSIANVSGVEQAKVADLKGFRSGMYGQFFVKKGAVMFQPQKPDFVTAEDWQVYLESLKRRGITEGNYAIRLDIDTAIARSGADIGKSEAEDFVSQGLNLGDKKIRNNEAFLKLYAAKLNMLLNSAMLQMDSFIRGYFEKALDNEQRATLRFQALDVAFLGSIAIRPFLSDDTKAKIIVKEGNSVGVLRGSTEQVEGDVGTVGTFMGLDPDARRVLSKSAIEPTLWEKVAARRVFTSGDFGESILNFLSDGIYPSGSSRSGLVDDTNFSVKRILQPTVGSLISPKYGWSYPKDSMGLQTPFTVPAAGRNLISTTPVSSSQPTFFRFTNNENEQATRLGPKPLTAWLYEYDSYGYTSIEQVRNVVIEGRNQNSDVPMGVQKLVDSGHIMRAYLLHVQSDVDAQVKSLNNLVKAGGDTDLARARLREKGINYDVAEAALSEITRLQTVVGGLLRMTDEVFKESLEISPVTVGNIALSQSTGNKGRRFNTPLIGGVRGYLAPDGSPVLSMVETERSADNLDDTITDTVIDVETLGDTPPSDNQLQVVQAVVYDYDRTHSTNEAIIGTVYGDNGTRIIKAGDVQEIIKIATTESLSDPSLNAVLSDGRLTVESYGQVSGITEPSKEIRMVLSGQGPFVWSSYQFLNHSGESSGGRLVSGPRQGNQAGIAYYQKFATSEDMSGLRDPARQNTGMSPTSQALIIPSSFHGIASALSESVIGVDGERLTKRGILDASSRERYQRILEKGNSVTAEEVMAFLRGIGPETAALIASHATSEAFIAQALNNANYTQALHSLETMATPPIEWLQALFGDDVTPENFDWRGAYRRMYARYLQTNQLFFATEGSLFHASLGPAIKNREGTLRSLFSESILHSITSPTLSSVQGWLAYFKTINGLRAIPAFEFTGKRIVGNPTTTQGAGLVARRYQTPSLERVPASARNLITTHPRYDASGSRQATGTTFQSFLGKSVAFNDSPQHLANILYAVDGDVGHVPMVGGTGNLVAATEAASKIEKKAVRLIEGSTFADQIVGGGFRTTWSDEGTRGPLLTPTFSGEVVTPTAVTEAGVGYRVTGTRRKTSNNLRAAVTRQNIMAAIERSLEVAGSKSVAIEPVRYKTAGFIYHSANSMGESGVSSLAAHAAVKKTVNIGIQTIPTGRHYVNAPMHAPESERSMAHALAADEDPDSAIQYSPIVPKDYGFAFKRLSDGRIAINITGSIYNNKEIATNLRLSSESNRQTGIDLRESLGYDPVSGTIHGQVPTLNPNLHPKGTSNLFGIFATTGESWKEEIRKAVAVASKSSSPTRAKVSSKFGINDGVPPEGEGDRWSSASVGLGSVTDSYSILHDSTSRGHVTITVPANATAEQIRAAILSVVSFGLHRVMLSTTTGGNSFDGGLRIINSSGIWSAMHDDMKATAFDPIVGARDVARRLASIPDVTSAKPSEFDLEVRRGTTESQTISHARTHTFGTFLDSVYPRIRDDIDMLIGMMASKEHGYFLPEVERSLAMQGEKSAVIEALFPNRPELQAYAWDSEKNANVSIVPRTERQRGKNVIVGYLVGYNEATGFDAEGRPTFTRRVHPVKTAGEAEALAARFRIGASKAELISMLKDGVAAGKQMEIKGQMISPAVADIRRTSVWSSEGWTAGGGWQVGDYPREFKTKAEAEAFKAVVTSGDTFAFVPTQTPQLMVGRYGAQSSDMASQLADIEQTLRRKVSFGTGHSAYQFVSKMMQAIAYGKMKTGKDTFPARLSGLNWYKFLTENGISKDEMRITGMAHLLAGLGETPISRIDLAQYLYTVYPRTFTVARETVRQRQRRVNPIIHESVDMPFIEDVGAVEQIRSMGFVENLKRIKETIGNLAEKDQATAAALEKVVNDAFEKMASYGAKIPVEGTIAEKIDFIERVTKEFYANTRESYQADVQAGTPSARDAFIYGAYAPSVTPQQMMLLADIIAGDVSDSLFESVNNVIGANGTQLELVRPFSKRVQEPPLMHSSGASEVLTPALKGNGLNGGPNYLYANFVAAGGNAHEGMATYQGPYRSQTWLTEVWSPRMEQEFTRLKEALKERLQQSTDKAESDSISAMLKTLDTVATVRSNWVSRGNDLGTYGHYDSGNLRDIGFQLGHLRTTQGLVTVSNGRTLSEGSIDFSDTVLGPQRDVEPTIAIEEVQSDNFQYRNFGKSTAEYSLPDTLEQAKLFTPEAAKRAMDLAKEVEQLQNAVSTETARNLQLLVNPEALANTDNFVMRQLKRKMLMGISNINRHLLYTRVLMPDGFAITTRQGDTLSGETKNLNYLVPTDRMMKVPESLVEAIGATEIPEYDWNLDMSVDEIPEFGDRAEGNDLSGSFRFFDSLNTEISAAVQEIFPETFVGISRNMLYQQLIRVGHKHSSTHTITPNHLLLAMMMADVELVGKTGDAFRMLNENNTLSGLQLDFDSAAQRIVSQISRIVDDAGTVPMSFERRRSLYVLKMMADGMKEMLGQSHNQNKDASANTVGINEDLPASFGLSGNLVEGSHAAVYADARQVSLPRSRPMMFMHRRLGGKEMGRTTSREGYPSPVMMLQHKHPRARTALGQTLLNLYPILADINSAAQRTVLLDARRKELAKMQKSLPYRVGSEASQVIIGDALPFGFEDSYKPVSIRGTVLRAMNAGFKQISMTDARHHFVRAHNPSPQVEIAVGRSGFITNADITGDPHGVPKVVLQTLMSLPREVVVSLNGGYIKRLMEFSDPEVMAYFGKGEQFDHNGVRGNWFDHLFETSRKIADGSDPALTALGDKAGIASAAMTSAIGGRTGFGGAFYQHQNGMQFASNIQEGSNLLGPDGRPIKYKAFATQSPYFRKTYGEYTSGEKTSQQRAVDFIVGSVGYLPFMSVETGRAGGFMNNYGLPLYWSRIMYWGQNPETFLRTACDAFQRPIVESKDGKTYILDPKTGKAITDIDNTDPRAVERVREAFLQHSKYLGAVPYISAFLSEFGPTGAYVTEGAMLGLKHNGLQVPTGEQAGTGYAETFTPQEAQGAGLLVGKDVSEIGSAAMFSYGQSKTWWHPQSEFSIPVEGVEDGLVRQQFAAAFSFGVEPTQENIDRIYRTLATNRTTIMRFAPKFQTPSMREAMRKKIVQGIPLMMVGRYAQGSHSAKVAAEGAAKAYTNYSRHSQEAKELALDMYRRGSHLSEISDAIAAISGGRRASLSIIQQWAKAAGLEMRPAGATGKKNFLRAHFERTGLTPEEAEAREAKVIEMLRAGMRNKDIVKALGLSSSTTVTYFRKRHGFPTAFRSPNRAKKVVLKQENTGLKPDERPPHHGTGETDPAG